MYWVVPRISRKQENTVQKMSRRQRQPEMLKRPRKKNSWFKMLQDDAHTLTNTIATTAIVDTGHHGYYHRHKTTGHRMSGLLFLHLCVTPFKLKVQGGSISVAEFRFCICVLDARGLGILEARENIPQYQGSSKFQQVCVWGDNTFYTIYSTISC